RGGPALLSDEPIRAGEVGEEDRAERLDIGVAVWVGAFWHMRGAHAPAIDMAKRCTVAIRRVRVRRLVVERWNDGIDEDVIERVLVAEAEQVRQFEVQRQPPASIERSI